MTWYTDGSAHPNPGPGGYGVVGVEKNRVIFVKSKQYNDTQVTNNEMELKAILWVMINHGCKITGEWDEVPIVYSDSAYCVNALNDWVFKWANQNWTRTRNQRIENLDLFKAYYDLYQQGYRIELRKIKGHIGHEWNELADLLATGKITPKEVMNKYGGL